MIKVNHTQANYRNNHSHQQIANKTPSFKGCVSNKVVGLMDAIEAGGLCAAFCVQDGLGMIFPRIYAGLHRNKDKTGKYNYPEAIEVSIREILTGPPMLLIPMGALFITRRVIGQACDVSLDALKMLGKVFKNNMASSTPQTFSKTEAKKSFYSHVIENLLTKNTNLEGDDLETAKREFLGLVENIENAKKSKDAKGFLKELSTKFHSLKKASVDSYSQNCHLATLDFGAEAKNTEHITKTIKHLINYTNDAVDTIAKKATSGTTIENLIEQFNKNRTNCRKLTIGLMLASALGFCMIIPKLYQINKQNPALIGLEDNFESQKIAKAPYIPKDTTSYFQLPFKNINHSFMRGGKK